MARKKRPKHKQDKDFLSVGKEKKYIIIPILVVLVGSVLYFMMYSVGPNATSKNIDYIQSFMTNGGKINDFQGKLGCKGIEDMKWYDLGDKIEFDFGRIILTWERDQFETAEVQQEIAKIGLSAKKNKQSGEIYIYWGGQEVPKWIK